MGFRPDPARDPPFALEDGVRYLVITLAEGRVVELKGCATRAAALAYAGREGHPPGSV
ncbi:MAG TPA: hypothetical protein VMW47_09915 [Verrucomicrobiae bacterium]|nr:hypothetical protein [Verrucomicrobiae bacterium]